MNKYYAYITVEGIKSLFEVHYETSGNNYVNVYNWFDRHGDSPDLSDQQVHQLAFDIRESLTKPETVTTVQQKLQLEFNGIAA